MSVLLHPAVTGNPANVAKIQIETGLRALVKDRVILLVTPSGAQPLMLRTPKPKKLTNPSCDWTPGPGGAAA